VLRVGAADVDVVGIHTPEHRHKGGNGKNPLSLGLSLIQAAAPMDFPKASLVAQNHLPHFESPQSIFDLLNFRVSEFMGISGSLVTRICENEYGITREEWQFVAMLAELNAMSPSDLAARTTVDRSQTSKTLRGLISKGIVERQSVPGDGRKAKVLLTEDGRDLYLVIFPRVVQVHHEVLQDLSPEARRTLAQSLSAMHARAFALAQKLKPEGAVGRRQGGSRANWKKALKPQT
jgi:DNA-binding MarR family transcriptional regulator